MKIYGNLNNRFDENHYFNGTKGNIKVGTPCTVYLWSDRHAYEVVSVEDQEHLTIRQLKAIRTDHYGMSDAQDYRYESNPNALSLEIALKNGKWRRVHTYTKEGYDRCLENLKDDCKTVEAAIALAELYYGRNLTEKQFEKVKQGKTVVKLGDQVNISFGVADEYYDYSF